jgi:hypothetical protein
MNKKDKDIKDINGNKDQLKEEVTDEEEEEDNKNINNIINISMKNEIKKEENNKKNVKDVQIKLLNQYKKAKDNINNSKRQSEKNGLNKNIINNKELSSTNNNQNIILSTMNSKYNSPSNIIYNDSSENKTQVLSTINKNTSFKLNSNATNNYNSNFSKKNNLNNDSDLQSIRKNLYNPKYDKKCKLYDQKVTKNIKYEPEEYTFLPTINQKSRELCEKNKNSKIPNAPIGVLLYNDANIKKEKLNQKCLTENNIIKSNANLKKININSYNLAIERINKKIDNSIKCYSKDGKLCIAGVTNCLAHLNIIIELFKNKDINDNVDFEELQSIIDTINEKDYKKLEEVEFLEQLWLLLNPSLTQYINSQILSELLKILLSSNNNVKDLASRVEKLFDKYNINYEKVNDNNNNNDKLYLSPLRDKKYNQNELWPLTKLIKKFLSLKQNLKAYQKKDYQKGDLYNNIIKERDKDLTFQPDMSSNSFFYKHSKYDYSRDNSIDISNLSNTSNNNQKQKHDFDKVYERFMAEKRLQEKTLERIRQIKNEKELKMCTNIPKINKYVPKIPDKTIKRNKNNATYDLEESNILKKSKSTDSINIPRFQKLYELRKKEYQNGPKLDENCTFKPHLTTRVDILNKTFSNMSRLKKPKGYENYVERNRSLLKKKEYEKKLEEDKKYGKNYEKVQKMKIIPFNITDLNGSIKKKKKNYICNSSRIDEDKNKKVLFGERTRNIIDDVYITIDIKIPNGLLKPLKIYNKSDNDTIDMVNKFCKIFSINDENKKIILKKVMQYKNTFFGRNLLDNKDGFILNEDLDTITNTYSNNSNH